MNLIEKYNYSIESKLKNFEKFVGYELFKMIKDVKGSIIECGVHHGGGLMAWAKLSSALEPYSIHRKIIGFDTFDGFPEIDIKDKKSTNHKELIDGGFKSHNMIYDELQESIEAYNQNRYLNQFDKIELVKGDANITIPEYIENNEHLIVSLLFLDFDIYQPTKTAMENFLNRMPRGAIIAFDEINNQYWTGETIATLEVLQSFSKIRLKKFDFDPNIAYAVVE